MQALGTFGGAEEIAARRDLFTGEKLLPYFCARDLVALVEVTSFVSGCRIARQHSRSD